MTPSQFYAEYLNRAIDDDGAYGVQCVDGWRVFCREIGVPVKATPNNYADGYWYSKDELGYAQFFYYITDSVRFQDGDWVIWARGSKSHPSSHIAMYYLGQEFGENQGGNGAFCLKTTDFSDALGALRWKGYGKMEIEKGYHHLSYKGINVDIVRATYANGYRLHLLSAGDAFALKDLMEFDSDRLGIVACVNSNYFVMATGEHLGVEADGVVKGYTQAPKKAGILTYYINDQGAIGAHDQSDYWLSQDQVQVAFAPYSVLIHNGQNVNMHSESFGSKDLVRNTQTAVLRIEDDWCLAIFSECFPSDVHAFAQEVGANELALMDSGGSTQMFECATTGKRRSIRHTSRLLPNVLVLAKELETGHPEPDPTPQPPVGEDPIPVPDTPAEPGNGGGTLLPDKVYDILKWVCLIALPALSAFVLFMGADLSAQYELIAKWINGIMMLLGSLIGVSTVQYNKVNRNE